MWVYHSVLPYCIYMFVTQDVTYAIVNFDMDIFLFYFCIQTLQDIISAYHSMDSFWCFRCAHTRETLCNGI